MTIKKLEYPFSESAVRSLKAGDTVSISGRIYTGRDKLHKFFADGGKLPVDFSDGALYHCGPVCVKDGSSWKVVAAGPTTSVRENPYEPDFIAQTGVRLVIGKGGMDEGTLSAMGRHGCVYIQAVGGAGALYAAAVENVAGVSFLDEFGAAEALWHFDVRDFRGIVAMDSHGGDLFRQVSEVANSQHEAMEADKIETIARGVCIRNGKVLLCRAKGSKTSYLPGGHIEFGETGRQALEREISEEAGIDSRAGEFLGAVENSFMQKGARHCEINLVYRLEIDSAIEVSSREDWIGFEWCSLGELRKAGLLPVEMDELVKSCCG